MSEALLLIHSLLVIGGFFGGIATCGWGIGEWLFSKTPEEAARGARIMMIGSIAGIASAVIA